MMIEKALYPFFCDILKNVETKKHQMECVM